MNTRINTPISFKQAELKVQPYTKFKTQAQIAFLVNPRKYSRKKQCGFYTNTTKNQREEIFFNSLFEFSIIQK